MILFDCKEQRQIGWLEGCGIDGVFLCVCVCVYVFLICFYIFKWEILENFTCLGRFSLVEKVESTGERLFEKLREGRNRWNPIKF